MSIVVAATRSCKPREQHSCIQFARAAPCCCRFYTQIMLSPADLHHGREKCSIEHMVRHTQSLVGELGRVLAYFAKSREVGPGRLVHHSCWWPEAYHVVVVLVHPISSSYAEVVATATSSDNPKAIAGNNIALQSANRCAVARKNGCYRTIPVALHKLLQLSFQEKLQNSRDTMHFSDMVLVQAQAWYCELGNASTQRRLHRLSKPRSRMLTMSLHMPIFAKMAMDILI